MTDKLEHHPHPVAPLAVSPNDAVPLSGLGRTTIYAAISSGDLRSIKIGNRRLIMVDWLRDWMLRHEVTTGE
ncbi:MAG: helix-turn-helix domain-containing protein [Pseudomonadota bacterium]